MSSARVAVLLILVSLLPAVHAQTRNGFDLSDSSVPAKEIRRTGVRRDGIPSIDAPKFVSAGSADFLRDTDRVLGREIQLDPRPSTRSRCPKGRWPPGERRRMRPYTTPSRELAGAAARTEI